MSQKGTPPNLENHNPKMPRKRKREAQTLETQLKQHHNYKTSTTRTFAQKQKPTMWIGKLLRKTSKPKETPDPKIKNKEQTPVQNRNLHSFACQRLTKQTRQNPKPLKKQGTAKKKTFLCWKRWRKKKAEIIKTLEQEREKGIYSSATASKEDVVEEMPVRHFLPSESQFEDGNWWQRDWEFLSSRDREIVRGIWMGLWTERVDFFILISTHGQVQPGFAAN